MDRVEAQGPHFAGPGQWYRGNLHCHTTNSDGRLSPTDACAGFAALGYDFLAITDHDQVTDPAGIDAHGLCLIPAVELTAGAGLLGTEFHILGIGIDPGVVLPPRETPGRVSSAWLRAQGGAVFVAHPHWSGLTIEDLLGLTLDGIEAYNGGTVLDSLKGEAFTYWDEALLRGTNWSGIATDDTHWHTLDRGTGWVMVRATARTPDAIVAAIKAGHFYSSTGPEIHDVHIELVADNDPLAARSVSGHANGTLRVHVETSPVGAIYLNGPGARSHVAFHPDTTGTMPDAIGVGNPPMITSHTFEIALGRPPLRPLAGRGSGLHHVRVSCMDWSRRRAWSNPLFF